MRTYTAIGVACALAMLAGAATVSAAEKIAPKTLEFLEATTISGYVQASYQHSWNAGGNQNATPGTPWAKDSPGVTPARVFNNTRDSFNLDQAKVTLEKPIGDSDFGAGYRVDLLFGTTASMIHSTRANGSTFDLGNDGDLEQAYVQLRIPVGNGLDVKFGKFVTLLGNEVIDAPPNWNYSRSYLFACAAPRTHTGALMSYRFNDIVDAQLAVVNGWDNVEDNNSGKTLMGRVGVTLLNGKLVFATMGIGGPEQNSDNRNYRWVVDEVVTWNATEKLSFAFEALYGSESIPDDPMALGYTMRDNYEWWGAALYAKYRWNAHLSTALRAEYFSDVGGSRLGGVVGVNTLRGPGEENTVDVQEYTLTFALENVWKNLTPRLEFRYDHLNAPVFTTEQTHSVFTASLDFIYAF